MGRERRKWTSEEDSLLREEVKKATQESRPLLWRELAKSVPGRTNKDCRRRWYNILADSTTKGSWTESEDERLCTAVQDYGSKWTQVAAAVGTRNSDQCSSHWSQSLNPAINYSDWTRVEDEKLIGAVQQYGTNWTMIAYAHLPNRTTLALKNRYSALRTKSCQTCHISKPNQQSETRTWRTSANHCPNQVKSSESGFVPVRRQESNDQSDDEDDDEDENENDNENNDRDENHDTVIGAKGRLDSEWQRDMSAKASYVQRKAQFEHATTQPSSFSLLAPTGIQESLNPSTTIEQWTEDFPNSATYFNTFPSGFVPNGYSDNIAHLSVLPGETIDSGIGSDGTASPVLYPYQPTYKVGASQPTFSISNPATDPALDNLMDGVHHTSQKEQLGQPTNKNKSPLVSGVGSSRGFAAQQRVIPSTYQESANQATDPSLACFNTPEMAPSPTPNPFSISPVTPDGAMHHVSIDAECTIEQLGDVMRTLVGVAKRVTVNISP